MTATTPASMGSWRSVLIVSVLVSAAVGGLTGYATTYLTKSPIPTPEGRTVFLFTTVLGFNETKAGEAFGTDIPHDYFAPDRITVNKGDRVEIRYYNTEDQPENHTFTMSYSTYNFNSLLQYQEVMSFNFTADTPGVFQYICTLHQPTMTGYLVVLGS